MAGGASHGRYEEPGAAGAGVLIDDGGHAGTLGLGRLVAESGLVVGQRKVVVDGLGYVDVLDVDIVGEQILGCHLRRW